MTAAANDLLRIIALSHRMRAILDPLAPRPLDTAPQCCQAAPQSPEACPRSVDARFDIAPGGTAAWGAAPYATLDITLSRTGEGWSLILASGLAHIDPDTAEVCAAAFGVPIGAEPVRSRRLQLSGHAGRRLPGARHARPSFVTTYAWREVTPASAHARTPAAQRPPPAETVPPARAADRASRLGESI